MKKAVHLRKRRDPVFGVVRPLPKLTLPLVKEVGQALIWEAEEIRLGSDQNKISQKAASESVKLKLLKLYKTASIPTLTEKRVKEKVQKLWGLRQEALKKFAKHQSPRGPYKSKNGRVRQRWEDVKDKLFEIAAADVPDLERPFLEDQRGKRRMVIGQVDPQETHRLRKREKKEQKKITEAQRFHKVYETVKEKDWCGQLESDDSNKENQDDDGREPNSKRRLEGEDPEFTYKYRKSLSEKKVGCEAHCGDC